MPLVGQSAPAFEMLSTKNLKTLDETVSLADYQGKWLVMFFYPADFTFVCPTEITAMQERLQEFRDLGADVLGVSCDSVHSHKAWIEAPPERNGLGRLDYPLAADFTKVVARAYDVLVEESGQTLRGLFIIDPDGVLRYQVVHDMNVGRSVDETLRVLQALQSGGLCPVNWQPGEALLQI